MKNDYKASVNEKYENTIKFIDYLEKNFWK
mgnify:CR=1 FL=1